jgi:excisionase family DNA binding protein
MASVPSAANEFLTSEEVIEVLQRDPVLRRVALTCVLPAVRVGEEWRFRRTDLDAWIAKQTAPDVDHAN